MAASKYYIAAGGAAVIVAAGVVLLTTGGPSVDQGGNSPTNLSQNVPRLNTDMLSPVGQEEASRRATANDQKAEEAKQQPDQSYVAPPVIAEEVNMGADGPLAQKPPVGLELPEVKPIRPEDIKVPESVVVQRQPNPQQEVQVAAERERIKAENDRRNQLAAKVQEQVNQLLANNAQPNINIQGYKEPPKKESNGSGNGVGNGNGRGKPSGPVILAAKPGDVFYASLKVGFNSEDPRGLPVYATIYDQRGNGSYGPLHGGVLAGQVTYSNDQAAVTFRQMTLRDGRTAPIQAMAATLDEVRPGVAAKVDRHALSRWSGLVAGSLLQGLGQAGRDLVRNDTQTTISDGFATTSGREGIDWQKVGLATLEPLGSNLSQVMARNFQRKPTMSSPAGTDVGIVFLQQVTVEASK